MHAWDPFGRRVSWTRREGCLKAKHYTGLDICKTEGAKMREKGMIDNHWLCITISCNSSSVDTVWHILQQTRHTAAWQITFSSREQHDKRLCKYYCNISQYKRGLNNHSKSTQWHQEILASLTRLDSSVNSKHTLTSAMNLIGHMSSLQLHQMSIL
jgi:hypothetical protein